MIIISPGEYSVSTTLKVLKPLHIYAYGVTLQVNASSTSVAIQIGDKEHPIFSPHSFKGAKILNVGKRGEGIGCETDIHIAGKSENVIIEAVNICDSSDFGAGVWIEHVEHTIIKECYFENNPNIDIKIGSEKNASDSYTN